MLKEKYNCDICRKPIPYKNTIVSLALRLQTEGIWHAFPEKYEHVCVYCQDRIVRTY
jgi:hypothetical protein